MFILPVLLLFFSEGKEGISVSYQFFFVFCVYSCRPVRSNNDFMTLFCYLPHFYVWMSAVTGLHIQLSGVNTVMTQHFNTMGKSVKQLSSHIFAASAHVWYLITGILDRRFPAGLSAIWISSDDSLLQLLELLFSLPVLRINLIWQIINPAFSTLECCEEYLHGCFIHFSSIPAILVAVNIFLWY